MSKSSKEVIRILNPVAAKTVLFVFFRALVGVKIAQKREIQEMVSAACSRWFFSGLGERKEEHKDRGK